MEVVLGRGGGRMELGGSGVVFVLLCVVVVIVLVSGVLLRARCSGVGWPRARWCRGVVGCCLGCVLLVFMMAC